MLISDRSRVYAGLNLYSSGHAPEALLMTADGDIVHRWRVEFDVVFPDQPAESRNQNQHTLRRVDLLADGSLIAIFEGLGIVKLGRDSRVIWSLREAAHHDFFPTADGGAVVLTRAARPLEVEDRSVILLEDFVVRLDGDGRPVSRASIVEAVRESRYYGLYSVPTPPGLVSTHETVEMFHTNTLEPLAGGCIPPIEVACDQAVLVSFPFTNTVGLLDLGDGELIWALSGLFDGQHDPSLLPNGRLLLFDNGRSRQASRVIEVDPLDGSVVWEYGGSDEERFYSWCCSTVQALPNGNRLITVTDEGRAFEVTPDHEVVWEFWSPHRAGEEEQFVAALWEVQRVGSDRLGWLETVP